MPVYNGEKHLTEAIDSVLNQTFTNFEFIIINDGSTDNSKNIIDAYDDKRITHIEQENNGLAKTLNIGASYCNGEFIARMDQDDICKLNRFSIQYSFLKKYKDISVVSSAVSYINEKGCYLGRSFPYTWPFLIRNKLLNDGCVINHPAVMMRRNDFEDAGRYSEVIDGRFTDYHLWVKLIKRGYKIKNISKVLLKYRISDSAMSSKWSLTNRSKELLINLMKVEKPENFEIDELNNALKNSSNKRNTEFSNKQNYFYLKLNFIGENLKSNLFSGIKNMIGLTRLISK